MATVAPPSSVNPPSPPDEAVVVRRPGGDGIGAWPILFVLVVFAVIAAVVFINNGNPEMRRVDLVAQQYADAWTHGTLADLDYDTLSGPDINKGDPDQVAQRVQKIVKALDDGTNKIRPAAVSVDTDGTRFSDAAPHKLARTRLKVTWELQHAGLRQAAHVWTYFTDLVERQDGGVWRVVWTPQTVHPALRNGMVFQVTRSLAARASVLGAGDTALPPDNDPNLAKAVLGSITRRADAEQAKLDYLRSAPGDTIGLSGLQNLYDQRLAGGAEIVVTASVPQTASGVTPIQSPLFRGAPETPTPIQLTLDARTQQWAEAALRGVNGAATLVIAKPSTGAVLAVANTSATVDYGLGSQQPPGAIFGLTSYLAMLRQGFTPTSPVDCRQPFTFPGEGQQFRNALGPNVNQVRLAAAIEGGCTTALARLSNTVSPVALQTAAWDLGVATPLTARDNRTPSWLTVADQLGTPAYLGRVNSDSATDLGSGDDPDGTRSVDQVHHAQNMVGEGKVLVSPLSVTRATMTVATGERRSPRLITNPAPTSADVPKPLEPAAVQALQEVMAKGVTELGGSAHALASLQGSPVYALAATAGYGTGRTATRAEWVTGYRGDYAFTVLIPNAPTTDQTSAALGVASRFLANIP